MGLGRLFRLEGLFLSLLGLSNRFGVALRGACRLWQSQRVSFIGGRIFLPKKISSTSTPVLDD